MFGYDKYILAKIKYKIKYRSLNATTVAICPKAMVKVCHGRHVSEPLSNLQTQSNLIQQLTILRGQSQYVSFLHLFGHALNSRVGSDELDSWVPLRYRGGNIRRLKPLADTSVQSQLKSGFKAQPLRVSIRRPFKRLLLLFARSGLLGCTRESRRPWCVFMR